MYIENALKTSNNLGRYVIGIIVIFIFSQLGTIPFIAAIISKTGLEGASNLTESNMMTILGDSNLTLFYFLLSFVVGFLGLYLVVKYLHRQSFLSLTTSRSKIDLSRLRTSFFCIALITILNTVFSYFFFPEEYVFNFEFSSFIILFFVAIVFIPIQTSFEEYVFRGYLMQGLGVFAGNKWFPLILTSFSFGFLHFWNPEVSKLGYLILVHYVATGLFLGIITLMDEGMELALGFHAGNNLLIALLVTADWTVFQTNSVLKYIAEPEVINSTIISVLVIYPLLLIYFSKKYKWSNWREKLLGRIN
jgi:membrane protease YdiL (CAAX protease family)|tara:strand:+ start:4464 stop:5378 length:915 start_codon:yes stop_codon:yes gene_type:complete